MSAGAESHATAGLIGDAAHDGVTVKIFAGECEESETPGITASKKPYAGCAKACFAPKSLRRPRVLR